MLREVRSAYPLSKNEHKTYGARYGLDEDEIAIANVRHSGHWWVARIAEGAVEKAILQISHFSMPGPLQIAGHLQIRFKLQAGKEARLVPQANGDVDESGGALESTRLADLVYSPEAVFSEEDPAYNLAKGFQNRYGLAHRIVSIADRQRTMTDALGNPRWVEQAEIRISPGLAEALLLNCALAGKRHGLSRMYHTLTASCATEVIARLDETFAYGLLHEVRRRFSGKSIPVSGFRYLRARGLLGNRLPDLNAELPWRGAER